MAKSDLISNLIRRIAPTGDRLTFVSNPDGLLSRDDVRRQILQKSGIEIISGSQLDLRIHFETDFKDDSDKRFVYLVSKPCDLLPDMKSAGTTVTFAVNDMFPLFQDRLLLRKQSLEVLTLLYADYARSQVRMAEARFIIDTLNCQVEKTRRNSVETFRRRLSETIPQNWLRDKESVSRLSAVIAEATDTGVASELEPEINGINAGFQKWVDDRYFAAQHSNHLFGPQCVNKILPYIAEKHRDDKVALLVVDGLSYWQYAILGRHLAAEGLKTDDGVTLSWLPSITMLSRQAIFRGEAPRQDYKQSPANESRLWRDYWRTRGFASFEVQYLANEEWAVNEGVKRLALVAVEMDEKMHAMNDYKELALLTDYWAERIIPQIKRVLELGFTLYLTTDHGSTYARGWRPISQVEKVFLYKDGSRGARHLIYNNMDEEHRFFVSAKEEISLLMHDNWLAVRDSQCFATQGHTMITHGGSHFMEVVVPWIKIKK